MLNPNKEVLGSDADWNPVLYIVHATRGWRPGDQPPTPQKSASAAARIHTYCTVGNFLPTLLPPADSVVCYHTCTYAQYYNRHKHSTMAKLDLG
eukprot:COSAG01_NODE_1863_length_9037_cov_37.811591_8_plen_94_part_00